MVSESRVTWATSVPILFFLGLSVLELGPMYASWACEWQLRISVDKCSILTVGSCSVSYKYVVADSELPCKTHCKDLGIIMSRDLSPLQHIGEITAKAYRRENCI